MNKKYSKELITHKINLNVHNDIKQQIHKVFKIKKTKNQRFFKNNQFSNSFNNLSSEVFKEVKEEHPENIQLILLTLLVLK